MVNLLNYPLEEYGFTASWGSRGSQLLNGSRYAGWIYGAELSEAFEMSTSFQNCQ